MTDPQTTTTTRDEAVLRYYADTFCELGSHHECCGKLNKDECSGCLARSALASAPAPASGGVDAVKAALDADNGIAAFERWAQPAGYLMHLYEGPNSERRYLYASTDNAWLAWCASRASLSPAATPGSEAGGEHDARLSEHPAFQAPAGMPGVEEIARVIFSGKLMQPANGPWRDDVMTVGQKFCLYAARDVLSLFAPILAEKERATVKRIAQVASEVSAQAGVGASETAGLIVSVLAANPEQTERFMAEGSELFIDGTIRPENGCLTHMAMNGQVVSPTRLRMMKGQSQ